jgi:hypothetical protein
MEFGFSLGFLGLSTTKFDLGGNTSGNAGKYLNGPHGQGQKSLLINLLSYLHEILEIYNA